MSNNYVACAFCNWPIYYKDDGTNEWLEPVADHFVYKQGELQYIEIAHVKCAAWDPTGEWST